VDAILGDGVTVSGTELTGLLERSARNRSQSLLTGHRTGCSSNGNDSHRDGRGLLVGVTLVHPEASLGGEGNGAAHRVLTALFGSRAEARSIGASIVCGQLRSAAPGSGILVKRGARFQR
jgi:hypothetical protein